MAEEAEPELLGARQQEWMDRLEAEHDNMRAALTWSLETGATEPALRLAGALFEFWYVRGYFGEGRGWLEEALAKDDETSPDARARALWALACLAGEQSDYERAGTSAEEALALYRGLGDEKGVSDSLSELGWAAMYQGDDERATAMFEESLVAARESKDDWSIGYALNALSIIAGQRGDFERAETLWEEALALYRELGTTGPIAESLAGLAGALEDFGRTARLWGAADALRKALGTPWLPLERRLYEPYLTAIRSRADEAVCWTRAWEEGRAMLMDETVTYALEDMEERA